MPSAQPAGRPTTDMTRTTGSTWALLGAGQALAFPGGERRRQAEVLRQAAAEAAAMGAVTEQRLAE